MGLEELKETQGAEAGLSSELKDPSAQASFNSSSTVIGTAGMIQEGGAVVMSPLKSFLPLIEGLSGDAEPFTSQGDIV